MAKRKTKKTSEIPPVQYQMPVPQYGFGDVLAGGLSGAARAIPLVGGLVSKGVEGIAGNLGADTQSDEFQLAQSGVGTVGSVLSGNVLGAVDSGADLIGDVGTASNDQNLQTFGNIGQQGAGIAGQIIPLMQNSFGHGGNLTEFNGLPHEQGGLTLGQPAFAEVEDGETESNEYVYSDRLKIKEGRYRGKTFADASKKIEKKYSLREDDVVSKQDKQRELKRLREHQEIIRSATLDNAYQKAYGGSYKKMPHGGPHEPKSVPLTDEELRKYSEQGDFPSSFSPVFGEQFLPQGTVNPYGETGTERAMLQQGTRMVEGSITPFTTKTDKMYGDINFPGNAPGNLAGRRNVGKDEYMKVIQQYGLPESGGTLRAYLPGTIDEGRARINKQKRAQQTYSPYIESPLHPDTGAESTVIRAKGGWIQKATASIKRRGTEGVCTGDKFGSSSCPPGSKRYNLAKTFRAMAAKRAYGGYVPKYGLGTPDSKIQYTAQNPYGQITQQYTLPGMMQFEDPTMPPEALQRGMQTPTDSYTGPTQQQSGNEGIPQTQLPWWSVAGQFIGPAVRAGQLASGYDKPVYDRVNLPMYNNQEELSAINRAYGEAAAQGQQAFKQVPGSAGAYQSRVGSLTSDLAGKQAGDISASMARMQQANVGQQTRQELTNRQIAMQEAQAQAQAKGQYQTEIAGLATDVGEGIGGIGKDVQLNKTQNIILKNLKTGNYQYGKDYTIQFINGKQQVVPINPALTKP